MNVQLKQVEIVAALTGYLAAQGINLVNKEVKIDFTAGRKASGIIADITIDDAAPLTLVVSDPVELHEPAMADVVAAADPVVEPEEVVVVPEKTTSLFG